MSVEREELLEVLRSLLPEALDLLVESIRLRSTHGNESEVQQFLARRWSEAGFKVENHPIPEDLKQDPEFSHPEEDVPFAGRENLVVRTHPAAGDGVIINAHSDVVPAEEWEEAFEPHMADDTVYGRGACDDKGCIATMYLAALAIRRLGLKTPLTYQMVIDEEVGGNGSLALIREGVQADGAVVLEPTELHMHPANRGAIWFRFEFEGTPCHMGRKHEGVNALDLACETKSILYRYEKELIGDQEDQPLFAHYEFPTQVNVGTLHGGEWPSMVCAEAVMEGGVGFLPNRPMEQVKEDLVRYIDELGSEALKERYELSFPKLHNDSYETPPDDPFVQAFHRATERTDACEDVTGWNVSCDARLFNKIGGLPTVVFGPGSVQDAHSAEEKVRLADIVTAAETLFRFAEQWRETNPR